MQSEYTRREAPSRRAAATPARRSGFTVASEPAPVRRTITITGHPGERYTTVSTRRSSSRRYEKTRRSPDRVAMWAVLLGLALALGAATSSHAAVLHALVAHAAH